MGNNISNGEKVESIPYVWGRAQVPVITTFQCATGIPSWSNKGGEGRRAFSSERKIFSLLAENMILYTENAIEPPKTLIRLIN